MKEAMTIDQLADTQIKLEIGMKKAGIARFHKTNERAVEQGSASETNWNKRIIQELVKPMADAIDAYKEYYTGRCGKPVQALKYLMQVDSFEAAFVSIKTVLDKSVDDINLDTILDNVGYKIEDQVRFAKMEDHAPGYVAKVKERLNQARSKSYKHQHDTMVAGETALKNPKDEEHEALAKWTPWGIDATRHVGAALVNILVEHVTFEGAPVFEKVNQFTKTAKGYKETTKLRPTATITDWIDRYKEVMEAESPAFRPCIIPPRDWTTPFNGGYHIQEIADTLPMVKARKSQTKRLTIEQMPAVYKAVNGLQNVAWTVDSDVLNTAQEIVRMKLNLAMPQREPYDVPASPVPEELQEFRGKELQDYMNEDQWDNFMAWRREATAVYQADNKRKAMYLDFHRTISSAKMYEKYPALYFVHTLDFRGRIYAKSDTINPQGDDFQKGLIRFANGKPLGQDGRYWLAVQGAGKWGEDKCSFDDRVAFIENMTEEIRDMAADPLTFTEWAGADKPWQFLCWAFEWAKLQDWEEEGNKTEDFVSYIPCAQDGSCSGLQHYSAILRDPVGGKAVNLVPGPLPNDIYGEVATVCARNLEEISLTGESDTVRQTAAGLLAVNGGINRSLTKPPVMTKTYGSTQIRCLRTTGEYFVNLQEKENKKAKAQKREPVRVHPFAMSGEEGIKMVDAEKLCSKQIWEALKEVVVAANTGMKYIQDIASVVAKYNAPLEWITPTGFIVEQKELEYKSRRVKTQLLGNTRFTIAEETRKINRNKMKTSSAPNFIHSMDSSHLTLAVNGFLDAGMDSLAIIHDDFGSHACDTGKLRDILRDTFVSMYEENDVMAQFKEHNEMCILEDIDVDEPETLGLDLSLVRDSEYAFG